MRATIERLNGSLWRALRDQVAALEVPRRPQAIEAMAVAALVLSLASVLLLDHLPLVPQVGVVTSVALALLAVHLALVPTPAAVTVAQAAPSGDQLERHLERLEDRNWQLRETDTRYRELLDSLDDIILRRDAGRRLTFVNRAFCRAFAMAPADAIGHPFQPEVLSGESRPATPSDRARPYVQKIMTTSGERWVEWIEHPVPGDAGEIQTVGRDVTERHQYEHTLCRARDAAEAANRAKSRFLATMSHEIRTPMNGILGMASLLEDTQLTSEQKTYTRAIDQSARNLLSLIDEILDFSKIEAGKLTLVNEPFSLAQTLQSAVELLAPRAHEKRLEMASLVARDVPAAVVGDAVRIRQILLNLISNAVKFTDEGGVSITVSVLSRDYGDVVRIGIAVEDTGIGLSAADMATLFAEFEQSDAAVQRRQGGTGLGLAISKRLARAMGGDLTVESRLGHGSTFRLEVPVLVAAHGASADGAVAACVRPRVLLAFDKAKERAALAATLDAAGVPCHEVDTDEASTAIDKAVAIGLPYDRIIVDGCCDAAAMAELLARARDQAPAMPVKGIVLVDMLAKAGLAPFCRRGFDAYLIRPVRPQSLLEQVGATASQAATVDAGPTPALESSPMQGSQPAPQSIAQSAPSASQQAASETRQPTVLLAEDNAVNALLATKVLELSGFAVVHAPNGPAAIEVARQRLASGDEPFALVLMDIFMPGMDGVEAAAEIRRLYADGRYGDVTAPPIVALTANALNGERQRYLELGLDDYLAKPFDREAMRALLARWVPRSAPGRLNPAA